MFKYLYTYIPGGWAWICRCGRGQKPTSPDLQSIWPSRCATFSKLSSTFEYTFYCEMDCVSESQICKASDSHTRHISKENQTRLFLAVSVTFSKLSSTFYYRFYYTCYHPCWPCIRNSQSKHLQSVRHFLCSSKSTTAVHFELHREQFTSELLGHEVNFEWHSGFKTRWKETNITVFANQAISGSFLSMRNVLCNSINILNFDGVNFWRHWRFLDYM